MLAGLKRRLARLEAVRLATDAPPWPTTIKIIAVPAQNGRPVPGWVPTEKDVIAVMQVPFPSDRRSAGDTTASDPLRDLR